MPFADGTKAQDESAAIDRRAGLIGVPHDARIEQGRRLERVLVKKIRPDEATLRLIQVRMRVERLLHVGGASLEDLEQVSVTACEIFQHVAQLPCGRIGIEPNDPLDDMVGPRPVGRIEIPGLSRRPERSDDDPARVRTEINALAVQEPEVRQECPLGSFAMRSSHLRRCGWFLLRISYRL
jgi:hypothetical protein